MVLLGSLVAAGPTTAAPGNTGPSAAGVDLSAPPLAIGPTFAGIGQPPGAGAPPDVGLAVGPASLVLTTNAAIQLRAKDGHRIDQRPMPDFYVAVLLSQENAGDVVTQFDPYDGRFFVLAAGRQMADPCTPGVICTTRSRFLLAVSKGADPRSLGPADWYFYAFDTQGVDRPSLGIGPASLVLTSNITGRSDNQNNGFRVRVLPKAPLLQGQPVTSWHDFDNLRQPNGSIAYAIRPAVMYGAAPAAFMVSHSGVDCGVLVWGASGDPANPTVTMRQAATDNGCGGDTQGARQPSPFPDLATTQGGGIVAPPVYRDGFLWVVRPVDVDPGGGAVAAIRWMKIDVRTWPNAVSIVEDHIFAVEGLDQFYAALAVDDAGDLGMVYGQSSPGQFPSISVIGRLAADPAGLLRPPSILRVSPTGYNVDTGSGRNRWGDYFGAALDPADGSVWVAGEFATSTTTWGTWVGREVFADGGLTLAPSSSAITWGTGITLNAHLETALTGVSPGGRVVTLQISRDGQTWSPVSTADTDALGNALFTYRPANNLLYRVTYAGSAELGTRSSLPVRVVVRQTALLRPASTGAPVLVPRGVIVHLTTTVRPSRPDLPAPIVTYVIYRSVGGHAFLIARRTVTANLLGIASISWTLSSTGIWSIRSMADPTPLNANSLWSTAATYAVP